MTPALLSRGVTSLNYPVACRGKLGENSVERSQTSLATSKARHLRGSRERERSTAGRRSGILAAGPLRISVYGRDTVSRVYGIAERSVRLCVSPRRNSASDGRRASWRRFNLPSRFVCNSMLSTLNGTAPALPPHKAGRWLVMQVAAPRRRRRR